MAPGLHARHAKGTRQGVLDGAGMVLWIPQGFSATCVTVAQYPQLPHQLALLPGVEDEGTPGLLDTT